MDWLVVLRINVDLAIFQPYLDLAARDNQSLKFNWPGRESNPGPLAPQAKSITTRLPLLPYDAVEKHVLKNAPSNTNHLMKNT